MSEKATNEHLLKCAINHSDCSIVDAFREFHQSGEISNNTELILDAAEFFQKLAKELQLENEQLAKDKAELVRFVEMVANGSSDHEELAVIHTKIHAREAKLLLEKHK